MDEQEEIYLRHVKKHFGNPTKITVDMPEELGKIMMNVVVALKKSIDPEVVELGEEGILTVCIHTFAALGVKMQNNPLMSPLLATQLVEFASTGMKDAKKGRVDGGSDWN